MSEQSANQLDKQLKELEELNRVVTNGLNWLSDVEIKVAYIQPIGEFIGFLNGFKGNVENQRKALQAQMPTIVNAPSVSAVTGKVIEPEVLA